MSNEQLVLRIQSGEDPEGEYILKLWQQNQGLIRMIAAKYAGYAELDDLQQEGYIALCNAARLYDPDRGASFSHYAKYWIKQGMIRYVENNSNIRLPSGAYQQQLRYNRMCSQFITEHGRMPSDAEICDFLRIDMEQVDHLKKTAQTANLKSLDEVIADEDGLTVGETVADPSDQIGELVDQVQHEQLAAVLHEMVDTLPDDQQEVIRLRYYEQFTMKEIAERTGGRAETLRRKAMNELRRPCNSNRLIPFLPDHIISLAYGGGVESFKRTWTSSTERAAIQHLEA
ncbi:MAG: sigma-70 family RNA polymerase sigma factor [Tannerellaceae bacterium]|nr:sigma-70 family RNA polymerase sigma factor [Tannerellaceae bacterium]